MIKNMVRFSKDNPNWEKSLEGKWAFDGNTWGAVSVLRNVVFIVAYKGAKVSDYVLPEVHDGFLLCSDGTRVQVNDSKLTLNLAANVSAQGILMLTREN